MRTTPSPSCCCDLERKAGAFQRQRVVDASGRCSRENSTSITGADALDDGSFFLIVVPSFMLPSRQDHVHTPAPVAVTFASLT